MVRNRADSANREHFDFTDGGDRDRQLRQTDRQKQTFTPSGGRADPDF